MFLQRPSLQHKIAEFGKLIKTCAQSISFKLYRLSFFTGRYALRIARSGGKASGAVFNIALSEFVVKAGDFARNISEFKRSRLGRGEFSPTRALIKAARGFTGVLHMCRIAFHRGGFLSGLAFAGRAVRHSAARFFDNKRTAINYIAPVLSILVLVCTIYFWKDASFALSVTYDGKTLGMVSSEQVYRDAADRVEENVSDASGSNFGLNRPVSYKMVLAKKSDLSNEDQLYNNIVMRSCNGVKTGYGLYIDNQLAGANSDSTAIEAMLNSVTSKYKSDTNVQSVGFVQKVSIKNGVFPSSVFKNINQIEDIVTAKNKTDDSKDVTSARLPGLFRISLDPLYAMNLASENNLEQDAVVAGTTLPTLTVKVIKNEVQMQPIAYNTVKVESAKLKKGKTKISVQGANGIQQVVEAVTYVNGVKTGENVISSTILKKPVTQKILVGTKESSNSDDEGGDPSGMDSGTAGGVIGYAQGALGIPYVSGGISRSGFDCSGFTAYVFSKYGIYLPHSAAAQSAYGSPVGRSSLQSGDLVFFDTNGGHNSITHVGIYIGGGSFIDASSARPHCITVDNLNGSYYSNRYMTARRVK